MLILRTRLSAGTRRRSLTVRPFSGLIHRFWYSEQAANAPMIFCKKRVW